MQKFVDRLHYITHDVPQLTHVQQAELACSEGAKWLQYRCLSKTDDELLKDINEIAAICDDWGTTLIVTDHTRFAGKADIQGFHIEDMDADIAAVRAQLGDEFTIGGSANTLQQLIILAGAGADYAGFGPFDTTETKPNDLPHVGLVGYASAMRALEEHGIMLPVLAVGGVTLADVSILLETGIYGVAVSGAINFAEDHALAYREFYNLTRR